MRSIDGKVFRKLVNITVLRMEVYLKRMSLNIVSEHTAESEYNSACQAK